MRSIIQNQRSGFLTTDGEEASFKIGNIKKYGFYISHATITEIMGMFPDWKERFEFFSQEGGGEIRKYSIPARKKSVKEKQVVKDLKRITGNKKK